MTRSILFLLLIPALSYSQTEKKIEGRIINVSKDTLIIYPDRAIPSKFYEIEETRSQMENEEFKCHLLETSKSILHFIITQY